MKKSLVSLISFYQRYLSFDHGMLAILAPGGACRHELRCSEYTKQVVIQHGVFKGLMLGLKRIWSCR